jgi:hypothetical protein
LATRPCSSPPLTLVPLAISNINSKLHLERGFTALSETSPEGKQRKGFEFPTLGQSVLWIVTEQKIRAKGGRQGVAPSRLLKKGLEPLLSPEVPPFPLLLEAAGRLPGVQTLCQVRKFPRSQGANPVS